jgi:dihydropyrimidinase
MFRPLLIRNGLIVNATESVVSDVLVREGKVAAVGPNVASSDETQVIDAAGAQVLPGGIDPHVHLAPFVDDFETGSKAALAGGITTIGVMIFPEKDETIGSMLARHAQAASAHSSADVVLHSVLNVDATPRPATLSRVVEAGQTTCKIFTMLGNFDRDYASYIDLLHRARALRLLPMFHCEDQAVMQESVRALKERNQSDLGHYEPSRPVLSEELAVHKVLALCELTGCPVYIVHVSSARALEACESAQRRGLPVHVETRPIYLHFDAEKYRAPEAPLYVSFPPIRSHVDSEALWRGLAQRSVHTVGSDHAALLREQKCDPRHCCIDNPRPGMANLQEMLPMLYSEGVLKGRLTLERFVQVTSTNAANLLGLYPQKGVVAVGSDADLNIWDPKQTVTFRAEDGFSRADFSLYEGWAVTGVPRMTIRHGEIVYGGGKLTVSPGSGRLLRREPALSSSLGR